MTRFFALLVGCVGLLFCTLVPQTAGAVSSDPKMFISADNTFYAYVKAGETVEASFARVNQEEPFDTPREAITITLDGSGIEQQKCVAAKDVAIGQGCKFTPITAQKSGIWRINFDVPDTAKAYPEVSSDVHWGKNLFSWSIAVKSGDNEQHGRLWTERYATRQPADQSYQTDFTYYYVSEDGYIYRAVYKGYNGQISTLSADGIGIRKGTTCASVYRSTEVANSAFSPALGLCGSAYKLFFEEPAGNLPTMAARWDGKTDWVRPNISKSSVAELHFNSDKSTDQQSGTISYYLRNFIGQYEVKIDVDNDGSFDGQNDVTIQQQMKQPTGGLQRVRFSGTDKTGQIVPPSQKIGIKVVITKVAEIHLVAADVEGLTGGLALTRLSGENAPTTGLCWNDKELLPLATDLMPEVLDGRDCPDSAGSVHSWPYADGSWGNARYIDNWVYATATLQGINQIVYPSDEEIAETTNKSIMPLVAAIGGVILLVGAGVIAAVLYRRRRTQQSAGAPNQENTVPSPPSNDDDELPSSL